MKKCIAMLMMCILILGMSGCAAHEDDKKTDKLPSGGNIIYLFCVEENRIVKSDSVYQLKQPDSVTASIEEVMTALVSAFEERILSYKYMLDEENNVSLELSLNGDYSKEENLVIMAAVSNTMFQLKELGSIRITMNNLDGEVVADELFFRDSFYFYDYPEEDNYNMMDVTIYSSGSDGTNLVKSAMVMFGEPNVSIEEKIVSYLASAGSIPRNTRVNAVSVNAGVCYLDLSSDFEEYLENVKSEVVVYSVVNSITTLPDIDMVQILIDGENYEYYRKTVDIGSPLVFNHELVEK